MLYIYLILSLLAVGCNAQKEEEQVDYDQMVKNEEEWTSTPELEGTEVAGDLYPEPQEILLQEVIDAPSRLDSTTIR